jgi:hypothetical protein
MKRIALLFAFGMAFGCLSACSHAQVPPTHHSVTLSGTAPAGCTGCTYVFSRATITGSACPATTGTSYTPLNQASPAAAVSFTDTTASGSTACYVAQTLQAGAVSVPSNVAGPFTVPADPAAPSLTGQTASMDQQPLTPTNLALAAPMKLVVKSGE